MKLITAEQLQSWLKQNTLRPNADFVDKVLQFGELLYQWNEAHNFTRVPVEEFIVRHVIDSLMVWKAYPQLASVSRALDVGTGPGLPGLILALACPQVAWALIDSQQKRIAFLEVVVNKLGLSNVHPIHSRLEDFSQDNRFQGVFEFVSARAFSDLTSMFKYIQPLLRAGGVFIAHKGEDSGREVQELKNKFNAGIELQVLKYQLPGQSRSASLVTLKDTSAV